MEVNKIVERTGGFESKEISQSKLRLMNSTMARIILKLIPNFGEDFQHYNVGYLSTALNIHGSYVNEVLGFLCDKDMISFDGESYYLSQDNLWRVQEVLNRQSIIILLRKIESLEGSNKIVS